MVWVQSESNRASFGNVVDQDLMGDPATGLAFDIKEVVITDGEGIAVERVA